MGRNHLTASLAAHAVLLVLLYYFGAYQPTIAVQNKQLEASRLMNSHAAMRKRVADMERIKDLMRESMGDANDTTPDNLRFDATTAEAPDDLLKRAETLSRDIDAMNERMRVDEYARATGVDRKEAARQLALDKPAAQDTARKTDDAPAAAPENKQARTETHDEAASASASASVSASASAQASDVALASASAQAQGSNPAAGGATPGPTPETTAARIAVLEQHARDVLTQRQRQLERAQQGAPIGGATPTAAQGKEAGAHDLAGRIAAFINRDMPQVTSKTARGYWGNDDMFDHGQGQIASVDTAAIRKGAGHKLGHGGEFANRVFVNNWYLIGPFPGKHGRDMFATDSYPPEQAVVLDAAYRGKDGRFLTWRHVESAKYPLVPPDTQEDSVYYGYTELMMDSERDLDMWIGADDDAQVWINDRLAWKGGNVNKLSFFHAVYNTNNDYVETYNLNEGKVRVHFRKGRNKVFFKLSNGPNQAFFSMVLTPP